METALTRELTQTPPLERKPHLVIEPTKGWRFVDMHELWQYRDLLFTLANRDIKLRYRQTALGAVWIILGPLLSAGIFSFIFGRVAKLNSEGVPYFLFVFAGQLGWNAFSNVIGKTSGSLVSNIGLVSKIYFPRMILPLSSVFGTLLDFSVGLGLLAVLMGINGVLPNPALLLLPVWLLLLLAFAVGIGLIASAFTVTYRDVIHIVAQLTPILMYATPVLYSTTEVPTHLLSFYYLNPLASLMQGLRWSLLGTSAPPWGYAAYSAIFVSIVLVVGAMLFNKKERKFADVI